MFKEAIKSEIGEDKWEWIISTQDRTPEGNWEDIVARILTAALEAGFELPKDRRWPNEIKKGIDPDLKQGGNNAKRKKQL
jgi:hypothetical protein